MSTTSDQCRRSFNRPSAYTRLLFDDDDADDDDDDDDIWTVL